MSNDLPRTVTKLACAGIGASAAGPLGLFFGSALGSCATLFLDDDIRGYLQKGMDSSSSALTNVVSSYIYALLKDSRPSTPTSNPLRLAVQEAMRRALKALWMELQSDRANMQYADWFQNWETRFDRTGELDCADFALPKDEQTLDDSLLSILVRVDFEQRVSDCGRLAVPERSLPTALRDLLLQSLPPHLDRELTAVLSDERNRAAWVSAERTFLQGLSRQMDRIESGVQDVKGSIAGVGSEVDDTNQRVRFIESHIRSFSPTKQEEAGPKMGQLKLGFSGAAARLRSCLGEGAINALAPIEARLIRILSEDKLSNGGWGRRNNKTLRTFFGDLPDDFDTEGSLTLTRWVIDAVAGSSLLESTRANLLDQRLLEYLDARFDRKAGASGRVVMDVLGKRSVHIAPRHTATSVLCYLGLGAKFRNSARLQVPFLRNAYATKIADPNEIGHPDALRALCLSLACFPDLDGCSQISNLIGEGMAYLWDWLISPRLIPDHFGQPAHLYMKLYSLGSISDLGELEGMQHHLLSLRDYRESVRQEVEGFCESPLCHDHRKWGFPALLLWSYFCKADEALTDLELVRLFSSAVRSDYEYESGYCVCWAVLLAVIDSLLRPRFSQPVKDNS